MNSTAGKAKSQLDVNARQDLLGAVTQTKGTKLLFCQDHVFDALSSIGVIQELSQRNDVAGVFPLRENIDHLPAENLLYICNPDVDIIRSLVTHLMTCVQRFPSVSVQICFTPKRTIMMEHILEEELKLTKNIPAVSFRELDFDMTNPEEDLYVLHQPHAFKHLFVDGDISCLEWAANSIVKLEALQLGPVQCVRGVGSMSVRVARMVDRMHKEVGKEFLSEIPSQIDTLLILDRTLDLATPLMTQLTYEGLVDEMYTLRCGQVSFPFSLGEGSNVVVDSTLRLDSRDRMFQDIRDRNFTNVGSTLYEKSVWVKKSYDRRREVHQLKELKEFMKGLPEMQEFHRQIGIHTAVATEIGKTVQGNYFRRRVQMEQSVIQQVKDKEVLEFVEELINRRESLSSVIRLLCLYSVINGGIKPKDFDSLKESMMLSFGIPHVITLWKALEKAGLLSKSDQKANKYPQVRRRLNTWNNALNEQTPNDIAYAYSGYAPPLVRLVEELFAEPQRWAAADSDVDLLASEKIEMKTPTGLLSPAKTLAVCVLGGLTAAEISCLRFVQNRLSASGVPHRLVIVTTDITSGKRFVTTLAPFSSD